MPKEEWGVKRMCPTTGKRFYDLNKKPIVSPYTGEAVEIENGRSRMIAADAADAATLKAKAATEDDSDDLLDDDDSVDIELEDDVLAAVLERQAGPAWLVLVVGRIGHTTIHDCGNGITFGRVRCLDLAVICRCQLVADHVFACERFVARQPHDHRILTAIVPGVVGDQLDR